MKKKVIFIILIFLIICLIYISNITNIPNNVILFDEEEIKLNTVFGVEIENINQVINLKEEKTIQTVSDEYDNREDIKLNVNLFGIKVKEISVNILEEIEVVPLGGIIGMKLYTKGVLVVGMSEIYGQDNKLYKPYENTGIKEGDTIIKINNENISSTEDLIGCINNSKGKEIKITYLHNERTMETSMTPIEIEKNSYKIGLWVRDAAARCWNCNVL